MKMQLVASLFAVLILGQASAFAKPYCSLKIDGKLESGTECLAYPPLDPESYQKSIRCFRTNGILMTVDYGQTPDLLQNGDAAIVHLHYLNKFEDLYVNNEIAQIVDYKLNSPEFDLTLDLSYLIPSKATEWNKGKTAVIHCDLRD
ncbi:MAG: hypothetical protein AB7O96_06285 [Pseudobdellovibrionaceae bacterium]